MERPDINTLACVNEECQLCNKPDSGNLVVRKVYGQGQIRLLRYKGCGEEFSERRGTALFNIKIPEERAESVIRHLNEGCSVSGIACLVRVAKETVYRLLKVSERHTQRFHGVKVRGVSSKGLEFDEQWSFVKKKAAALW